MASASAPAGAGDLPPGWVVRVSTKTGQPYFFNTTTGESTYVKPPALPQAHAPGTHGGAEAAGLPPGWAVLTSSKTGLPYFFNAATGESRYDRPALPPAPVESGYWRAADAPPAASAAAGGAPHRGSQEGPDAKRARVEDAATALRVASAYDGLEDRGREGRRASGLLHLKNFNNWVKATLIQAVTAPRHPAARVLDLACGKMGDLQKWRAAGVSRYCGVDISRQAVEDAAARFNEACGGGGGGGVAAKVVRADLGAVDLAGAGVLAPGEQFDAISIQFALHYLFQSEARALNFFSNIAGRLAPGGVFLGTIPDAAVLIRRLRDVQAAPAGAGPAGGAPTGWGNSLYSVQFDPAAAAASWELGAAPYGVRYTFYLAEAVDHVDEYLVPWQLLVRLAAAVGLKPIAHDNFHAWYERQTGSAAGGAAGGGGRTSVSGSGPVAPEARALLKRMRVLDVEGTMTPEEWEVAGLYRVFAFQAPLPGEAPPPSPLPPGTHLPPPTSTGAAAGRRAPAGLAYQHHVGPNDIVDLLG
jgi:mRNA (guanine-N7-)-methyltransferase